nr:SOS response-associated peptidase family protein [Luteibacter rhizovicinus]
MWLDTLPKVMRLCYPQVPVNNNRQDGYLTLPNGSEIWFAEPGKVSGDIHDRQPVILPPDLWAVWYDGMPDEASATLVAAPEAELVYYPVTKAVGSPRNKGAELVEPITI